MIADQVRLQTVFAGLEAMMQGEFIPMPPLGGCQGSRSVTKGSRVPQGGKDGAPDKFRAIPDAPHGLGQVFVDFECDNFRFIAPCAHQYPPK